MTQADPTAEANPGVCYRHPKRESWVLCQRCGRTICPECQTAAAVGVQCPECVREGRASMPRRRPGVVRAFRSSGSRPVVTYSLMGVSVAVFLLQLVMPAITQMFAYAPALTAIQPWRMITSTFLHSTGLPFHILFNMFALFLVGRGLEPLIGRGRFLALYLISGFAGSVAVLLFSDPVRGVLGASGAVFGLFAAFIVIARRMGGDVTSMLVIVALNLVVGFFLVNVSWQAHVGGLVGGAAVALVLLRTRRRDQRGLQIGLLAGVVLALLAISVAAYLVRIAPLFPGV